MNPHDGQSEVLWNMKNLAADSDLDAETLGKLVLTAEGMVHSGLVTQTWADKLLADRKIVKGGVWPS